MQIWIAQIFNGLSVGSILLLAALGLAFSFGLMKVINMAHGEFIMVGAYVTYFFQTFLAEPLRGENGQQEGLIFVLSIVAAFLIAGALGQLLERFVIRRLYGRPLDTLLATSLAGHAGMMHVPTRIEPERHGFCADGFHPSREAYAAWASGLAALVLPHLQPRRAGVQLPASQS